MLSIFHNKCASAVLAVLVASTVATVANGIASDADAGVIATAADLPQRHYLLRHPRVLDEVVDIEMDDPTGPDSVAATNPSQEGDGTDSTTLTGSGGSGSSGGGRTRTDLVPMSPFDVQIAFAGLDDGADDGSVMAVFTADTVDTLTVNNAITDWMLASFTSKAPSSGIDNTTVFDTLTLQVSDAKMQISSVSGRTIFLYTAYMDGVSIWERPQTTDPVNPDIVELVQRATFLEDNDLLTLLSEAGPALYVDGEGDAAGIDIPSSVEIVDVRAFVAPPREDDADSNTNVQDSDNESLEIIIIIAIVVACLAFALLIFAVVWAWRSDRQSKGKQPTSVSGRSDSPHDNTVAPKRTSQQQQQQQQYISTNNSKSGGKINGTQKPSGAPESSEESEVDVSAAASSNGRKSLFGRGNSKKAAKSEKNDTVSRIEPVVELPKNNANLLEQPAPENEGGGGDSVISDDINTSLTAYYRSGVTGYASGSRQRGYGDDAASLSSMDSYGYSLDGYAPSLGTAPHAGYPAGPLHAAGRAQIKVGDEDETQQEEVEDF